MEKECEDIARALEERLETHDNSRRAVQDSLHEFCEGLRRQINEMEENVNKKLEEMFTKEDDRLQEALADIRRASSSSSGKEDEDGNEGEDDGNENESPIKIIERAKAELLVTQSYNFVEHNILHGKPPIDFTGLCDVEVEKHFDPEGITVKKPTDVRVAGVSGGNVVVGFTCLNPDEIRVISENNFEVPIEYRCLFIKKGGGAVTEEYLLKKAGNLFSFVPKLLELEATYIIRVKMILGGRESEWSDGVEFTTSGFEECCRWKECPDNIEEKRKYSVDENNTIIATKIGSYYNYWCTIIGNTPLPLNTVTSWSIKILKSEDNDGGGIFIGVAPSNIDQNESINFNKCGWYFYCYNSELFSGPPHNCKHKAYGPRKGIGQYVHKGDSVGVVMDTAKGELSFVVNGVNRGVAFEGIPLDKPLVPCALLSKGDDSVELILPSSNSSEGPVEGTAPLN